MSAQALVRVGEPLDLYYCDKDNAKKQAIPVSYDTRYSQNLTNLSQGVSVFTIPPNQGVRHCVVVLGYSAAALAAQTGNYALEQGWGYNAIRQISFRIGGSSQYFLSGTQLLQRNLRLTRTKNQRDSLLSLGGQQCYAAAAGAGSGDFATAQYAYIPISIWAAPGEDALGLPLPTDLLSQQVQVTVELNPNTSFWSACPAWAGSACSPPASFTTGYFQIEQLTMDDRGMALANRVNMADHMYTMPLPTFDQQEFQSQLLNTATDQPVVLSGFRAGEVKKVVAFLTNNDDTVNKQLWYAPASVTMLYAGQVYPQYQNGSSAIWNLLDGTAPAAVSQSKLNNAAGAWTTPSSVLSTWAELPFSQPQGSDYEADILVHGKMITNGIVNLQVTPPFANTNGWTLHIIYVYNCAVGFSKGSADLIF